MTLTVYGTSLSPFARKVMVVLAEKGLDYELEQVNPFGAPDWFPQISPYRKIPVLRDTDAGPDATLPDSSIICAYLERAHPKPALYPSQPFAYAKALWYEEFADTALSETIGRVFFYQRVVRRLMGQEPDEAVVRDALENKQPPRFAYLNDELAGKDYLVDDSFSIADIAVACQLGNFRHAGGEIDAGKYPNLAAFAERLHGRPSFKKLIAAETAVLDKRLGRGG